MANRRALRTGDDSTWHGCEDPGKAPGSADRSRRRDHYEKWTRRESNGGPDSLQENARAIWSAAAVLGGRLRRTTNGAGPDDGGPARADLRRGSGQRLGQQGHHRLDRLDRLDGDEGHGRRLDARDGRQRRTGDHPHHACGPAIGCRNRELAPAPPTPPSPPIPAPPPIAPTPPVPETPPVPAPAAPLAAAPPVLLEPPPYRAGHIINALLPALRHRRPSGPPNDRRSQLASSPLSAPPRAPPATASPALPPRPGSAR